MSLVNNFNLTFHKSEIEPARISCESQPSCVFWSSYTKLHLHGELRKSLYSASVQNNYSKTRIDFSVRATSSDPGIEKDEQLKDAAKIGDLNRVRELISSGGVDINSSSSARAGFTALQLSAFYNHLEVTSYLLWAGADTEGRNNSGNTALQLACLKGNIEVAKVLLEAGADLDAASNDKGTAYDYAQEWGGEEMVDFLLIWAASQSS